MKNLLFLTASIVAINAAVPVTIVNSLLKGLRYVEEMSVAQLLEHPAPQPHQPGHVRGAIPHS